ncbi:MAG: methyltransferase [Acidobacteria bacterium]|jgi:23S rRNA (uracil1939-C5)-methyltransferase|nr:methyltransferase [Acidobacteriota bacterium]
MASIGTILAIAKGGAGIVRDGEKTVFIPGVIAGETVEYAVSGRLRSAWQGKLLRVLEASPQRVEPPCPHYGDCGGCNLQHMSYGEQLRSKVGILADNLRRIARFEPAAPPPPLASPPERYRVKAEFQVRGGAAGFFARESHRIVAISGCRLLPPVVQDFFLARRPGLGGCEHGQLQVISNGRELAARLDAPGNRGAWLDGGREVEFKVGAYVYRYGPGHFVQANLFQLQPMLGLLEGALAGMELGSAMDLYCGGGFFTLPLAARCREVLALESDADNVAALRANLALNKAGNVRVVQADVLSCDLALGAAAGMIVIDPPRGGLSPRLISALAAGAAGTIVYFSCDSATFARDLRLFLAHGLSLAEIKLLDNFPHSDHFEIFSVLKRV